MAEFKEAYKLAAGFEGDYSNDPEDRGGETYCGIARNFFPKWAGWKIIDEYKNKYKRFQPYLPKDSKLNELVQDWYEEEWWNRLKLGGLDQKLANEIFEECINLGKTGAITKLQTVCNAYNYNPKEKKKLFKDLTVDGLIGPATLNALATIIDTHKTDVDHLVHALNCMQGAHYLQLAAKKPSQRVFTVGWMTRTY